jgi:membrane protein DedA with SNARE-associated domain
MAVPLVALIVISYIGDILAAALATDHPLVLLAMNPRSRNLVLVTNQLDAVSYYLVGGVRLLLSDPLYFLLGYFYGDAAVRWLERKSPSYGPMARAVERFFGRFGHPLVFIAPNPYICLFAGASGMGVATFAILNVTGTITRLYLVRRVGETFESPIDNVLDFIREYRTPLIILSVVLVAFTILNERRHGRDEVGAITSLADDLEDADDTDRLGDEDARQDDR